MLRIRSFVVIFAVLLVTTTFAACKTDATTETTPGATCVGGVVVNGVCEAKCKPDLCVADNTCVGNQCRLRCTSHLDCNFGQACTPSTEDDTGADVSVCVATTTSPDVGAPCVAGTECNGKFVCPDGTACGASVCGGGACTPDATSCAGQDAGSCSTGTCDDGTPCVVPSCSGDACKALTCVSSGKGDATAYCTFADCTGDAACGPGLQCQPQRDPHLICGTKKGNSNTCGTTKDACVDPGSFTANGATYVEGPVCLMKNVCAPRVACDACASDLDCSLVPGRHCSDVAGAKACTTDCKANKDCLRHELCTNGACTPRFSGGCVGKGGYCETCRTDLDCSDKSGKVACIGGAVGERVCFDLSFPVSCTSDSGCPKAPSGLHGHCLDENDGLQPGDGAYHKCYLPFDGNDNVFSCWPKHN